MEPSKRLGDYEILNKLGAGGMGAVYRVRNVISDRIEAMKVLLPDLMGRQDLAARFLREIKVLAALDHPNIAHLRTAQTIDDQFVMVMELVEGQSLAQRLSKGPLSATEALQVIRQVLDALDYAHRQGVIHRDIKPANMMITPQGVVKLMDFGIARSTRDQTLTAAGVTTGSLSYMSPEQINGGTPDARSDLYSLGVSLYEILTGQVPFKADTEVAVMFAHLQKAPVPPKELQPALSPELNAVVLKAIAKDPGSRFQTAAEFRSAVLDAMRGVAPVDHREAATVLAAVLPPSALMVDHPTAPTTPVMPAVAHKPAAPAPPPIPQIAATVLSPVPVAPAAAAASAHLPAPPQPVVPLAAMPQGAMPQARRVQGGVSPILYVALGAFLVVAAIGATAYYARRAEATPPATSTTALPAASPNSAPAGPAAATSTATSSSASAETPASTPLASSAAASVATAPSVTTSPSTVPSSSTATAVEPGGVAAVVRPSGASASRGSARAEQPTREPAPAVATSEPPAATATPAAAKNDAQLEEALDRLETELDQLNARAEAVNGTLDRLKAEQARAGYGLRGDMAARQTSLNSNLRKAVDAAERKDVARADRFKTQAQADLEVLEKFIGR